MSNNSLNNKRIAKNTFFLYFRSIFLLLISLYTSRITLQVLGVENYGIYQVVGGVVTMFSMLSATLSSASQRFITYALGDNDRDKLKKVFSTCITLHIVLAGIVVLLLEVLGLWFLNNKLNIPFERLSTASWVMQFSIATLFINIISLPFNALITAHEKMSAFAYISILEGLLKLGSVFLLIFIKWDKLFLYAALQFVIALAIRIAYSSYSNSHFEEARKVNLKIDRPLFYEMFSFAGWNLFGNGSLVLRNQGVDIVLNLFLGVAVNAAKGVSNQVQAAVQQLVGTFSAAIKPQLTKSIAQGDYDRAFSLINNGSRYFYLMMAIMVIPIMVCAPELLSLWLGNVPKYAVEFVQWTMVYLLLDTLSRMLMYAIISKGNIKNFQIVVGGTKLLAVPLVFLLLNLDLNPLWGIWVNIILELICLIERLYFNERLMKFDSLIYIKDVILRCLLIFIVAYGLCYFTVMLFSGMVILKLFVSFTITMAIICLLGMKKFELILVVNMGVKILKNKMKL